jgi:hypothetical protein
MSLLVMMPLNAAALPQSDTNNAAHAMTVAGEGRM